MDDQATMASGIAQQYNCIKEDQHNKIGEAGSNFLKRVVIKYIDISDDE